MATLSVYTKHYISVILFVSSLLVGISCNKLVDVSPPANSVAGTRAYNSDGNAIAVLTGLYISTNAPFCANGGLTMLAGLSADELTLYSGIPTSDAISQLYRNNILATATAPSATDNFWFTLYNLIYNCNSAIEQLSSAPALAPAIKQQLLGEALFMRSFYYYYLVLLYGEIPLILDTDYKANSLQKRSADNEVWQQIITDLDNAYLLLSSTYLDGTLLKNSIERVRPTQGAAAALLARVYLYTKNWPEAEKWATLLIENTELYKLESLQNVFLANSKEAIWQLQPINLGWNTEDGRVFIIPSSGPDEYTYRSYLNKRLLSSFSDKDLRKAAWVDSITVTGITYYYPYKYKSSTYGSPVTEYQMMLRLGEQYLIRAEARAELGNTTGAKADLNSIRQRAGLSATTANTQPELLDAILQERRLEMFTELGQRWLDIKRAEVIDSIMQKETPLKADGATWRSYQQLYPIPQTDILSNPNLTQNRGY